MKKILQIFAVAICFIGNAQTPIHNFTFDGTYNNSANTTSYFQPPGYYFVNDRNANPGNAVNVSPGIAGGVITNLPVGTNPRTISIWVKFLSPGAGAGSYVYNIFETGDTGENKGFNLTQVYDNSNPGGLHQIVLSSAGISSSTKVYNSLTVQLDTWYNYVATFSGAVAQIYRNGVLIESQTVSGWNTVLPSYGGVVAIQGGSPRHIDDLQLYSSVLSATAISNLYLYNSTSATTITVPTISNVAALASSNSSLISYDLNANNGASTSIIRYGILSSSLSSQVTGSTASGSTLVSASTSITGLLPNTQYFYKIEATNSAGTSSSSILNFTTPAVNMSLPIAEYNFNNTYNNINGANPFVGNVSGAFVSDRHATNNNPNGALRLVGVGLNAIIPSIPVGSSQRSISIWYKVTSNTNDNVLFVYGNGSGEGAYGVSFNRSDAWYNFAWSTNTPFTNASNDGQWHHLVTTYDQSKTSRVYVDGVLKNTVAQNGWNTVGNTFWLGGLFSASASVFDGTVDDLKIYDYVLSQSQVSALYSTNTLTALDFKSKALEISLYPNPVKDILHIETATEIKSVMIFGVLGNQVMIGSSKDINVSNLSKGTYIVKVQDAGNNVSTKKIIKE